jgi:hypothetical protein
MNHKNGFSGLLPILRPLPGELGQPEQEPDTSPSEGVRVVVVERITITIERIMIATKA